MLKGLEVDWERMTETMLVQKDESKKTDGCGKNAGAIPNYLYAPRV